ncbi:TKL protein kinase [Saprolegnia parasitica CBS 223.65]|uniref:TKL protein kinase n=1 Tax=Saprolegnia parasitica (strain CBS 223.65) TaxID=695850 RepID=A0A067BPM1_SAPPC|nr:TKL protein kinase [Saprolegnia parasitica CBS 223.65]KDO18700.1 TKL protein kinase [Saprolegnia parasitica CBS 223.65]|eukprot:XP_012210593.1 TKL protein kinase [Saprolegnia parasitica CBS 223.65]
MAWGEKELLYAAADGRLYEVKDFVEEEGVDPNFRDGDGDTPLIRAARDNYLEVVRLLLAANADVNATNYDGATALHVAAANGYEAIAQLLLAKTASLSIYSDHRGNLPLHLAAANGHLTIVDRLLKDSTLSGLNCTNNEGWSPLTVAVQSGHAPVVSRLLQSGASLDFTASNGWTLLHEAAATGNLKVIQALLSTQLNIFAKTTAGETPLMTATRKQRPNIILQAFRDIEAAENKRFLDAVRSGEKAHVDSLLKKGVNVDTKDATGFSALHVAASLDQLTVALLLVAAGTTLDAADADGPTALHTAASANCVRVAELLVVAGAKLDATDLDRRQPLHVAAMQGHAAVAQCLLERGADINALDGAGMTPLHHAAMKGSGAVVKLLLKANASVSAQNKKGETSLHVAVTKNHVAFVQLLLAQDATLPQHGDKFGNVPLHLAAACGQVTIVDALLKNVDKSGIDAINHEGDSPLVIAVKKGHVDVVSRLLQAKASLRCTTSTGWTLLHEAAASGNLKVIQALVETPLNIVAKTTASETPLKIAIDKQHADDVLQALRDAEAAANRRFLDAVSSGDVELVDACLNKGVDINTTDEKGRTALHVAVTKNHADVVEQLVRGGATLVVCDAAGTSPLFLAAQQDKAAMADVLLTSFEAMATCIRLSYAEAVDKGHKAVTDVLFPHLQQRVADSDPDPEADRAAKEASRDALLSIFRVALDKADMEATLVKAVVVGHVDAVQCLLAMGADPTTMRPEQDGWTLLALAIRQANDAVAQVLYPYLYPGPTAATADALVIEGEIFGGPAVTVNKATYGGKAVVTKGPSFPIPREIKNFMKEIDTMRTCTSPYLQPLLAVLDNGSEKPHFVPPETFLYSPTMIMEYMELGDLHKYLQKKRYTHVEMELSTSEVALVVALALADLHRRKVIHRDVKSLNIFLSKTHYVRLGDLGSARAHDPAQVMSSNAGTLIWTAPEVLRDPDHAGEGRMYTTAADIYSFGVVLTELDTGELPFHDIVGSERGSILTKVLAGELHPTMSATCPLWLQTLANQCMAFDPTNRPTADAIVQELLLHRHDDAPASTDDVLAPSPNTSAAP